MSEVEFRKKVSETLARIEKAFVAIDPDIAECEQAMGALTITFGDRSRCILSAQPSVQQLWLALAAEGTAYHFHFDPSSSQWLDDKGRSIELFSFLAQYLNRKLQMSFQF